jgi:cyclic pyranopterin phosphate synthase
MTGDSVPSIRMVNVGDKPVTLRTARASGRLMASPATISRIQAGDLAKGDPLAAARLAGIMAAKRTAEIVPLCHPLPLDGVDLRFAFGPDTVVIEATVQATARTGVEMEALVAVMAAGLCIYDMAKSIDVAMSLTDVQLDEKRGGVRGDYRRTEASDDRPPPPAESEQAARPTAIGP